MGTNEAFPIAPFPSCSKQFSNSLRENFLIPIFAKVRYLGVMSQTTCRDSGNVHGLTITLKQFFNWTMAGLNLTSVQNFGWNSGKNYWPLNRNFSFVDVEGADFARCFLRSHAELEKNSTMADTLKLIMNFIDIMHLIDTFLSLGKGNGMKRPVFQTISATKI